MGKIIVKGARPLSGEIAVSGSKNAALPILFATLLTRGESRIRNVPDIGDVRVALDIISSFGASVRREGDALCVDTATLSYKRPSDTLVSRIRASTYLLGSCLARFGIAELQPFGGCGFQTRPIDLHLLACERFGASRVGTRLVTHGLRGAVVRFSKVSVGATVNAILLSATARGRSVIENYAREPHIFGLIDFLRSAGADITVTGEAITVVGRELRGGDTTVEGDSIEAGTYMALSALSGGDIRVRGVTAASLTSFIAPLLSSGMELDEADGLRLYGTPREKMHIVALPYPDFPTDLQPIAAPLLAMGRGGIIEDRVWQGRFGYLAALSDFGVEYSARPSYAEIFPSVTHAASVVSPDLRGGAAALLLALATDGESVIASSEIIERGYERIDEKLRTLGADIEIAN